MRRQTWQDGRTKASMAERHAFDGILRQLRAMGWRIYLSPILRCVDDTWTLRRHDDRLDYLFVCETGEWNRKRFTREPFGDYTNCYENKGEGKGHELMLKTLSGNEGQGR